MGTTGLGRDEGRGVGGGEGRSMEQSEEGPRNGVGAGAGPIDGVTEEGSVGDLAVGSLSEVNDNNLQPVTNDDHTSIDPHTPELANTHAHAHTDAHAQTATPPPRHTTLLAPVSIPASLFPHRMTDEQLLPTPGFVLPTLEQMGPKRDRREAFMGRRAKKKEKEVEVEVEAEGSSRGRGVGEVEVVIDQVGTSRSGRGGDGDEDDESDGSDTSRDDYEPEGEQGRKKKKRAAVAARAGKGKKRQVQQGGDEGEQAEDETAGGKKRKRAAVGKAIRRGEGGPIDPTLLDAGRDASRGDNDTQDDQGTTDSEEDDHLDDPSRPRRRGKPRRAKRLRVSIKDDLDVDQLATLVPGQAIGSDIDETTLIMADLAAGPGQGRISGKAIKLQQNRKEIERRREEQEDRRLKIRTEREMKMRGIKVGFAGQVEEQAEDAKGKQVGGDEDEDREDEEVEDIEEDDTVEGERQNVVRLPPIEGNADDEDEDYDERLQAIGEKDDDDPDSDDDNDDHQYAMAHNPLALSYDDEGNMIFNNVIDRQQMLREAMHEGTVFEDNDDLKFTNSMSHSKRASTIRWTKEMKNKLLTVSSARGGIAQGRTDVLTHPRPPPSLPLPSPQLLRQHGQVYETIAKIMALYYPMVERVHVANHLRVLNQRDPETLTWALSRENKLDIGESAWAREGRGERGERGERG